LQHAGGSEAESDSASAGVLAASNAKSNAIAKSFRGMSLGLMGLYSQQYAVYGLRYNYKGKNSGACDLTHTAMPTQTHGMAYSFLVFDFGGDEDAAQQARHRIEGWRQGFRLDKKLQLKFERKEPEAKQDTAAEPSSKASKGSSKTKTAAKTKTKTTDKANAESGSNPAAAPGIRMIVRLDFSDHEKLSHQRWLDRIPTEEPFSTAKPKIIRPGGPEFTTTEELFDSLD
jgi:hypothetical protein